MTGPRRDDRIATDLLVPAVQALRAAARDMDVTSPFLTRLAGLSGRRIPRPVVVKALDVLDEDPALRDAALAHLDRDDDSPARAFLERPPGWEAAVALARARARIAVLEAELVKEREERDAALSFAETAKERRVAAEEAVDALKLRVGELGRELERARQAARVGRSEPPVRAEDDATMQRRLEEVASERDRLALRLRRREERAKKRSRDDDATQRQAGRRPMDLAKAADLLTVMARPHRTAETPAREGAGDGDAGEVRLPDGVRPDAIDAIRWLTGIDRPVTVLIDGWNVVYAGLPRPAPGDWKTLLPAVRRLGARSQASHRIVVFFDTDKAETARSVGGVDVRFVDDADEALVAAVRAISGPVVVVSGDREILDDAGRLGAVTLWSSALAAWIRNER